MAAIDARTDLTETEKEAAKEEARQLALTAKAAIDASVDNASVAAAEKEGTDAIASVNPQATVLPASYGDQSAHATAGPSDSNSRLPKTASEAAAGHTVMGLFAALAGLSLTTLKGKKSKTNTKSSRTCPLNTKNLGFVYPGFSFCLLLGKYDICHFNFMTNAR